MEAIKIDRYEARLSPRHTVEYYAIAGKKEYRMPDCYKEMYDDKHLAIIEKVMERPELFNLGDDQATHYAPLSTEAQPRGA